MLPHVGSLYSIVHQALATKKERVPSYSCKLGADSDGKLTYKHSEILVKLFFIHHDWINFYSFGTRLISFGVI